MPSDADLGIQRHRDEPSSAEERPEGGLVQLIAAIDTRLEHRLTLAGLTETLAGFSRSQPCWIYSRPLQTWSTMHPREQLAVIRRGWPLVVAATVLAAVAPILATSSMPKVYESQAKLIVGQSLNSPTPDINVIIDSRRGPAAIDHPHAGAKQ